MKLKKDVDNQYRACKIKIDTKDDLNSEDLKSAHREYENLKRTIENHVACLKKAGLNSNDCDLKKHQLNLLIEELELIKKQLKDIFLLLMKKIVDRNRKIYEQAIDEEIKKMRRQQGLASARNQQNKNLSDNNSDKCSKTEDDTSSKTEDDTNSETEDDTSSKTEDDTSSKTEDDTSSKTEDDTSSETEDDTSSSSEFDTFSDMDSETDYDAIFDTDNETQKGTTFQRHHHLQPDESSVGDQCDQ